MRGELASARRMVGEAKVEPPFLASYRWKPEELVPVLNAMDSVIMSCAAMESLLQGQLWQRAGLMGSDPLLECRQTIGPWAVASPCP